MHTFGLGRRALPAPAILLVFACVAVPMIGSLVSAFYGQEGFTFAYVREFFTKSHYLLALRNTLEISATVTFFCIAIAYPVCRFFSRRGPTAAMIFVGALALSLAISGLLRTI